MAVSKTTVMFAAAALAGVVGIAGAGWAQAQDAPDSTTSSTVAPDNATGNNTPGDHSSATAPQRGPRGWGHDGQGGCHDRDGSSGTNSTNGTQGDNGADSTTPSTATPNQTEAPVDNSGV